MISAGRCRMLGKEYLLEYQPKLLDWISNMNQTKSQDWVPKFDVKHSLLDEFGSKLERAKHLTDPCTLSVRRPAAVHDQSAPQREHRLAGPPQRRFAGQRVRLLLQLLLLGPLRLLRLAPAAAVQLQPVELLAVVVAAF